MKKIDFINNSIKVPVTEESFRNIRRQQQIICPPFGPMLIPRVIPARDVWFQGPPPVEYHFRPVILEPPRVSIHGPPWYPSPELLQHQYYSTCNTISLCDFVTTTPRPDSNIEKRERKPVTITKPPELVENATKNIPDIKDEKQEKIDFNKQEYNERKKQIKPPQKEVRKPHKLREPPKTKEEKMISTDKHKTKHSNLTKHSPKQHNSKEIVKKNQQTLKKEITYQEKQQNLKKASNEQEILIKCKKQCIALVEDVLKENSEWLPLSTTQEKTTKCTKEQTAKRRRIKSSLRERTTTKQSKFSKMALSNNTDDEKYELQKHSSTSTCKITTISEDSKTKLNSALKFTPPQLFKVNKRPKESSEESPLDTTLISTHQERNASTPKSSIFFTPETTPSALKTPDVIIRPRVKRSLTDQLGDEGHSTPDSSLNSTLFYTPESSPNELRSTVKRFKTRWSDSKSADDINDLNEKCLDFQPELIGYQLIGDSQFCRFGEKLLGLDRVPTPKSSGRIGICVSGQTITDLHRRVKEKFYPISDKIILMIGTNDFLKNVDVTTMCKELSALIRTLQETVTNIVLLTLPPIPKLERKHHTHHFMLLDKYNSYIRSLENGDTLRIADVSPIYMSSPPYQKCRMHLFEMYFNGLARRFDLIHLNREGLEVIRKYILEHFL